MQDMHTPRSTRPQLSSSTKFITTRRSKAAGEFVELYNAGAGAVNLTGWSLGKGIDYVFPLGTQLLPGSYALVARTPSRCASCTALRRWGRLPANWPTTATASPCTIAAASSWTRWTTAWLSVAHP